MYKAIFIGSIGTLVETSELQRQAYNEAMAQLGINWHWDLSTYRELLEINGGQKRLEMLSDATDKKLSPEKIEQIHQLKTTIACQLVQEKKPPLRPFAKNIINYAQAHDLSLGLVTSTYKANVDTLLKITNLQSSFKTIITRENLSEGKPSPEGYQKALSNLNIQADEAIAVEDSFLSILAAIRAGVKVIGYGGANTQNHVFDFCDYCISPHFDDSQLMDPQLVADILSKIQSN
ncbi:MAG: HAD family hydrolase [Cyanobacterium sp.]